MLILENLRRQIVTLKLHHSILDGDKTLLSGGDFMEPKIVGIMFEYSDKTVSYWDGFSLTYDDQETIGAVLSKYNTEGYSVR